MGKSSSWERSELAFLVLYAICFYIFIIRRSLQLSQDHYEMLHGLRPGLLADWLNDVSDAQWRNFRGNLPILTAVFGSFTLAAMSLRTLFHFKAKGMAVVWLLISFIYLLYLHGVCIIFIMAVSLSNFLLVKIVGRTKGFLVALWAFNICVLLSNRVYEGYSFSSLGTGLIWTISVVLLGGTYASILIFFTSSWKELKHSIRLPTFSPRQGFILSSGRYWVPHLVLFLHHWFFNMGFLIVLFNVLLAVSLRMISFGYDYHWANQDSHFDQEKHTQRCPLCKSRKKCYLLLQERALQDDKFSLSIYLCYLMYAPLYIAGPIIGFNAFASQLDLPQTTYSVRGVALYGFRWAFGLLLIELMTHLFYYNAFALSGLWKQLSAVDVFIISYGVLNFMWLKFFLMWRFFRFWSLINGIEAPENMPKCINNCYNLESFWKSWHASFNKWLVRYMYIPLGGSKTKLLNVWVIFTFVALWHDLEWKLVSWAWLTCIFFIPELLLKSAASTFKVENIYGKFVYRELSAIAGSITITCLMVANLVGFVVGPSGINWLIYRFTHEEGLPVLGGLLFTFYVGTKLMFRIRDAKQSSREIRSAD